VPRVVFDEVNITLPMAFLSPGVTPEAQRLQLVTEYVNLLINFQNTCVRRGNLMQAVPCDHCRL
jgi:hypothetical protein